MSAEAEAFLHNAYLDARKTASLTTVYESLFGFREFHLGIAYKVTRNVQDAEDAVSRLYLAVPGLVFGKREYACFPVIASKKAYSCAIDTIRRSYRYVPQIEESTYHPSSHDEVLRDLERILRDVPYGDMLLSFGLGFETSELARARGVSPITIRSNRYDARQALQARNITIEEFR